VSALTLAGLPIFLYFVARRSEEETLRDWALVLTPKGQQRLEAVQSHTAAELAILDWTYEQARQAESLGRPQEAILVTAGERFRLRLYILARAFGTLLRIVVQSRRQPTANDVVNWQAIEAAHRDVHTLSNESIATVRLLLASLDTERSISRPF
jgi:hypothetical protein